MHFVCAAYMTETSLRNYCWRVRRVGTPSSGSSVAIRYFSIFQREICRARSLVVIGVLFVCLVCDRPVMAVVFLPLGSSFMKSTFKETRSPVQHETSAVCCHCMRGGVVGLSVVPPWSPMNGTYLKRARAQLYYGCSSVTEELKNNRFLWVPRFVFWIPKGPRCTHSEVWLFIG